MNLCQHLGPFFVLLVWVMKLPSGFFQMSGYLKCWQRLFGPMPASRLFFVLFLWVMKLPNHWVILSPSRFL
jgi:hypothetical protein